VLAAGALIAALLPFNTVALQRTQAEGGAEPQFAAAAAA
jgi:hypothetical protein